VVALGKALDLEHLGEGERDLPELAAGEVGLPLDELRLEALEGVGEQLGEHDGQVDGQQFGQEVEGAEVEIDHKHYY